MYKKKQRKIEIPVVLEMERLSNAMETGKIRWNYLDPYPTKSSLDTRCKPLPPIFFQSFANNKNTSRLFYSIMLMENMKSHSNLMLLFILMVI
jgi:hypothetical protein